MAKAGNEAALRGLHSSEMDGNASQQLKQLRYYPLPRLNSFVPPVEVPKGEVVLPYEPQIRIVEVSSPKHPHYGMFCEYHSPAEMLEDELQGRQKLFVAIPEWAGREKLDWHAQELQFGYSHFLLEVMYGHNSKDFILVVPANSPEEAKQAYLDHRGKKTDSCCLKRQRAKQFVFFEQMN